MKVAITESVIGELCNEGYIFATGGSKKGPSSKRAWTAVKKGPKYEQMQRDLFDPLLLISHHVNSRFRLSQRSN